MHSLELTRKLTPGQEDALRKNFPDHQILFSGQTWPLGSFLREIRLKKIPLTNSQITLLKHMLDSIKFTPGGSKLSA